MIAYGVPVSPYVRKVLVACIAKGLDYEHQPTLPGSDEAEFRAASPIGKIPALKDGDLQVSDSSVILDYLEEKYPAVPLRPDSPELRARSRWYEEWADTKLVEACTPFFFEHFAKKVFGDPSPPDEARLEEVRTTIVPVHLAYLESQAPESGFMFGDELGIADIALLSPMINGEYGGYVISAEEYPRTAAYRDRIKAHPAVAQALEAEKAVMGALAA